MKSLFDDETYSEIRNRLNNLSENSERQWGKMTPGQLACHLQMPLNIILEKADYGVKPNWLVNLLFKKTMYSDKLWRKNLPTAKGFKITDDKDFATEKAKLEALLDEFDAQRDRTHWQPHPAFGPLTKDQWGKMQYKHLDHHFRQYGV
ncbi:MAG: DUF1569 domain-containing protein [Bacteroidota bacterium]